MERMELPVGWQTARVGEVCRLVNGRAYSKPELLDSGKYRVLRVGNLFTNPHWYYSDLELEDDKYCQQGDLLYAWSASFGPHIWDGERVIYHYHIWKVDHDQGLIDKGFLKSFFHWDTDRIKQEQGSGSTMLHVAKKSMEERAIPIPPTPEQRRIADKLDTTLAAVDTCRQRLDGVAAILKRFRQAALAAATSGELTREWREESGIDMDWTSCRLAEIAEIQGGITKDSKKQLEEYTEIPYLRVANVQRGYLDLSEVTRIKVPPSRLDVLLLKAGDILFNEGGDRDKVGRGWIWEGQVGECVFQNHVFRARLHNSEDEPKFVSWWSNTRGADHFLGLGKQTTNLASISKATLGRLPINLPPPAEQREIVSRVEDLFILADQLEAKLTAARRIVDRLTPALLAQAFRGELVPQDSSDEPASELLAKLKAKKTNAAAESPRRRSKTSTQRRTMSITEKDSIKAAILNLKADRFSFDDLRAQAGGDYDSFKGVLFELLEEPSPVVRQVFDQEAKAMQLERIRP